MLEIVAALCIYKMIEGFALLIGGWGKAGRHATAPYR
jgi:hypothetical protein